MKFHCVLLIFLILASVGSTANELVTFKFTDSLQYGAASIGLPWTSPTLTSCAVTCRSLFSNCYSLVFNELTNLCSPGYKILFNVSRPSDTLGDRFYYSDYCDTSRGYEIHIYKSIVQCYYLAKTRGNYTTAQDTCTSITGRLMQAKSMDELELFFYFTKTVFNYTTYIGLTDAVMEGTFVWADGNIIDSNWAEFLFNTTGPKITPAEDCAFSGSYSKFEYVYDADCSTNGYFICERLP